jgi:carbamoyl-phosphate synthase large subunit
VLEISRQNGVKLVVPTIDPELLPLAKTSDLFLAAGARVHVSPPSVIEIAQNKIKTVSVLAGVGVPVPVTLSTNHARENPGSVIWPAFLKPVAGSASRGIRILASAAEIPSDPVEPMLVQELLEGPEYTVNIFIDSVGKLRTAAIHRRIQVRAGEVEKGQTERRSDIQALARRVVSGIPEARGVLCFQVIDDKAKGPVVFEINARFGGGYPLADQAGAKFAQWLIEEVSGLPCGANDDWRSGETMLRYDAAVFTR